MFSFPTVIMTILFALVVLYWVMVIIGTLDFDFLDIDTDATEDTGGLGALLASAGLTGVPATVALSILILWGWLFTALGAEALRHFVAGGIWLTLGGILVLVLALVLAVLISALTVRPLRRFFQSGDGPRQADILGKVCVVKTLRVDEEFGQAEVDDGGAGLLIQVRARAGNGLGKGSRALVVEHDEDADAFLVRPYEALLAETALEER